MSAGGGVQPGAFEWSAAAPEALGLSSAALEALTERLAAQGTKALLVARRDQVVCEWYAPDWNAARPHYSASLAKALVGGMSLIVALGDGRLRPDDYAARFVPQWAGDPQRARITIRHLATHTSGVEDAHEEGVPNDQLPGWKGQFWRRDPDPFTISRDLAPVIFPPGAAYHYSNPGMAMLAYCVTAALRGAPQCDIRTLLQERLYCPIGLRESEWSIGYNTPYAVEGLTLWATWGGGAFTARAVARIARLLLRGGDWQGERLLDAGWVTQALAYAGTPLPDRAADRYAPASGLCWYTNYDGAWPDVPRDAFAGAGAGHQVLVGVPSLDLIVVRQGQLLADFPVTGFWAAAYHSLIAPVIAALRG